jgi:ATP phosphoribosyltransferase
MEISDELFVYGKNVKDFLRVDKIKLGVLALAGVKELNQIVETQHLQIQAQQAKIEEQSQAINTLTESLKAITEHLAKLTTAFNEKK